MKHPQSSVWLGYLSFRFRIHKILRTPVPSSLPSGMSDMSLDQLSCDFPIRPINNTHCLDITYAEYFEAKGNPITYTQCYFMGIGFFSLICFGYKYYFNKNEETRVSLILFSAWSVGLTVFGVDPSGKKIRFSSSAFCHFLHRMKKIILFCVCISIFYLPNNRFVWIYSTMDSSDEHWYNGSKRILSCHEIFIWLEKIDEDEGLF